MQKRSHLVDWKICCSNKRDGDLGIKKLVNFNRVLLAKRCWRIGNEGHILWKRVLIAKYKACNGEWSTNMVTHSYEIAFWKALKEVWVVIKRHIVVKIGDGRRTKVWKDVWCGEDKF